MAASSSSSGPFFHGRGDNNHLNQQVIHQQLSSATTTATNSSGSGSAPAAAAPPPPKKKRNQAGAQNPDAEVIALSPKTLMTANRFICEVCNKGFQREQNLQLHRRGHNLPWKLKQKPKTEVKRKVYLCPEPTCVHHDPSRALGDLTGIKKHYFRKHGEKKFKCEKCSKRYAVQSDWKAHSKTCGTREYRCDCGTLFSRRDSFITHRAFCDALAQESARHPISLSNIGMHLYGNNQINLGQSPIGSQSNNTSSIFQDQQNPNNPHNMLQLGDHQSKFKNQMPSPSNNPYFAASDSSHLQGTYSSKSHLHGLMQLPDLQTNITSHSSSATNLMNLGFYPGNNAGLATNTPTSNVAGSGYMDAHDHLFNGSEMFSNNMVDQVESGAGLSSLLGGSLQQPQDSISPHMSATALLQKAAQMGSTTINNNNNNSSTLFRTLGSSSSGGNKSGNQMMSPNNVGMRMGNDSQLQGLMNSFAQGGSSIFGSGHGHGINSTNIGTSRVGSEENKLTLDFLGVGGMVRNFDGGFTQQRSEQQQQQHGRNNLRSSNFDPEMKSTQANHQFRSSDV